MEGDGSNQINLTNNSASDSQAGWSADGSRIVFFSNRDGNNEIYIMNADGSNQTRLTNNAANDFQPSMGTDDLIAFTSERDGNQEIYTMNSDGTNLQRITSNSFVDARPDWSPNGSKLTFWTSRDGSNEIYTMNTDGSDAIRITNTAGSSNIGSAWSPDGTRLAYHSIRSGNRDIYSIDIDGSNEQRLTTDAGIDSFPDWQPLTIPPSTITPNQTLDASSGPITYDTLANHTDTYEEPDPSSVTITTAPTKGTVAVDATTGKITYTPNPVAASSGSWLATFASTLSNIFFPKVSAQTTNQDSLTYQVCSTANSSLCTTNNLSFTLAANTDTTTTDTLANTGQPRNLALQVALGLLAVGGVWLVGRRIMERG